MSTILQEDGESYPSTLIVPENGDPRSAASFALPILVLANRLKYFFQRLGAFVTGGTVSTLGDLEWSIGAGKTASIVGSYGTALDLTYMPEIHVAGNLTGPLCPDASDGRLPHKLQLVTSSQTINPVLKNMFLCTPSGGNIDLTIDTAGETLVPGDHFYVLNRTTAFSVTIHWGATTFVVPGAQIGVPSVQELIWDGFAWVYGRRTV